jgi:hypothetical protein
VNGRNCVVTEPELRRWLEPTRQAYARHEDRLIVTSQVTDQLGAWLAGVLKR